MRCDEYGDDDLSTIVTRSLFHHYQFQTVLAIHLFLLACARQVLRIKSPLKILVHAWAWRIYEVCILNKHGINRLIDKSGPTPVLNP